MKTESQIFKKEKRGETPREKEISEEEIVKKLSRLGDLEKLEEKTDFPFDKESIEALARLVIKLEKNLSDYDTVLSDDASGRLPSLFLKKIINHVRKKKGLPPANIYFLSGGRPHSVRAPRRATESAKDFKARAEKSVVKRMDRFGAIKNFLSDRKEKIGKALIVTEFVSGGDSLAELMEVTKEAGIDFEAAVLSAHGVSGRYERDFGDIFKKVVYGRELSTAGMAFYNRYSSSGVIKNFISDSPHPESIFKRIGRDPWFEGQKGEMEKEKAKIEMKKAREDIDFLAEEFCKKLLD